MSEKTGGTNRLAVIGLWLLTAALALLLAAAGLGKFFGAELWTGLFTEWGYPAWLSYVVGAVELGGAVALLVPRLTTYAALVLMVIMVSATLTLILNPGDLGLTPAVVNLAGLSVLAWARRRQRWTPS